MGQKTSSEIRNLNTREAKCWRVIDQYIGKQRKDVKIPAATRLEAAIFVLKRLYPEKDSGNGHHAITVVVNIEKADEQNFEHQLQAPRFSVSSLQ